MLTMTGTRRDEIYELTPEQTEWRDTLRDFADREIAPGAARYDDAGEFPWENVKKMAGLGLFGLVFPEQYGGGGVGELGGQVPGRQILPALPVPRVPPPAP